MYVFGAYTTFEEYAKIADEKCGIAPKLLLVVILKETAHSNQPKTMLFHFNSIHFVRVGLRMRSSEWLFGV